MFFLETVRLCSNVFLFFFKIVFIYLLENIFPSSSTRFLSFSRSCLSCSNCLSNISLINFSPCAFCSLKILSCSLCKFTTSSRKAGFFLFFLSLTAWGSRLQCSFLYFRHHCHLNLVLPRRTHRLNHHEQLCCMLPYHRQF